MTITRPDPITAADIDAAQAAWGRALLHIGRVYNEGGDYKRLAGRYIDELYGYDIAPVLFKPTRAAQWPFRGTREDALSYFVGGGIAEDQGFAISPVWRKVRFANAGLNLQGDVALAMGHYFITGPDGIENKIEYSFGYVRDGQGRLRIVLHHSSFPFSS